VATGLPRRFTGGARSVHRLRINHDVEPSSAPPQDECENAGAVFPHRDHVPNVRPSDSSKNITIIVNRDFRRRRISRRRLRKREDEIDRIVALLDSQAKQSTGDVYQQKFRQKRLNETHRRKSSERMFESTGIHSDGD